MPIAQKQKRYIRQRKSKPGFYEVEGKRVHFDSMMEATIIKRLIKHGFTSGRWHRYRLGIASSFFRYTPDVHLSIMHDGMNRRALVEFKPLSTTQFTKKARLRMIASAHFYKDALCFLYVEKSKQWYLIERNGLLLRTEEPKPGIVPVSELPRPRVMIPIVGAYGRVYWERPGMFILRKTGDGIGFVVGEVFGRPKNRR
ncbi:MAG: hypothetical protein ACO1N2_01850 [Candidatus Saccharimonadota bacterium]